MAGPVRERKKPATNGYETHKKLIVVVVQLLRDVGSVSTYWLRFETESHLHVTKFPNRWIEKR